MRNERITPVKRVIVLGAGIIETDGQPSLPPDGQLRALAASAVYGQGLVENFIISGGHTKGVDLPSESALILDFCQNSKMVKEGSFAVIPSSKVHFEEEAWDTSTNFKYSKKILENFGWEKEEIGVLTNNYHMERALILAGNFGLTVKPLSAEKILEQHDPKYKYCFEKYYATLEMRKKMQTEARLRMLLRVDSYGIIPRVIASQNRR